MSTNKDSSRWAYWVCCLLLAGAFLMFFFTLDRYPVFFSDEQWFNESAARVVEGRSFVHVLHTQAPHAGEVLAPHGPFHFRTQTAVLKLFGITHFAARVAGYACGHLAILILCLFLLSHGQHVAAIVLAAMWIGDRAALQLLLGRPEGLSMLFMVSGFTLLVSGLYRSSMKMLAGVGICIGVAAGFNPAACYFGLCSCVVVLLVLPRGSRVKGLAVMAVGALVPVVLVLLCWLPRPLDALEQFLWHYSNYHGPSFVSKTWLLHTKGPTAGGWAIMYYWLLICTSSFVLLPLLCRRSAWAIGEAGRRDMGRLIVSVSSCFAVTGVIVMVMSSSLPYYFLYLAPWPIIALSTYWRGVRSNGKLAASCFAVLCVLIVAWLPSLAWNVMRVREAVLWYSHVDRAGFAEELATHIPKEAKLAGAPRFFVVARLAGLNYSSLPAHSKDPGIRVDDDSWMILSEIYHAMPVINPKAIAGRPLVHSGTSHSGSPWVQETYWIYGPATNAAARDVTGQVGG